jgi:PAS domain S-box-containing protein
MKVKVVCPHCARALNAPRDLLGRRVRCAGCGQTFRLGSDNPGQSEPETPAVTATPATDDAVFSRSMLMASPGLQYAPTDAMICRIVPETFELLDLSPAARAFLGETTDAGGLLDAIHPDDRELAREEFRQAAELGERHNVVLRLRGGDGRWHFVRLDAQARYGRDGKLGHVRCHFVDVTDRIREEQELRRRTEQLTAANEELRRANQRLRDTQAQLVHSEKLAALGTLAAGMAHEINNPLAFATSNAAVLERDVASLLGIVAAYREGKAVLARELPDLAARIERLESDATLPYLEENLVGVATATRRGLQRVAQIVANLRAFARLDRTQLTELNPNESLDQAVGLLADQFARARISVVRDYADVPPVECSAASINQVLFHLLVNAAQAVEDSGRGAGTVRLATRQEPEGLVIEVCDDGCGIPATALPRIFEPFFTTKGVGRGTGLGLSISHGIVREHGGTIEASSTLGKGSLFRVHLPWSRRQGS